ncbi:MAG: nucleoside-diphosphate kinase [Planctomycetota bacterium]|jgi:nucleoside-diphosphate kinase|nr:nucleoside-diphosphate kinase [Planctomycetota bacterium]
MPLEKTLIIIKPDAVARGLTGKIVSRFEEKGLAVVAMRKTMVPRRTAEEHYAEHRDKPFYSSLVDFITSAPVVLIALEGRDAVAVVRKMIGKTLGRAAEPGTIRGDYGMSQNFNLVHASDSLLSAARETALFFNDDDYVPSNLRDASNWTYDLSSGSPN